METINVNHKIVRITHCHSLLQFIKEMKDETNKSLAECKNIADILLVGTKPNGVLLLNESSITVEQWEKITENCKSFLTWEYV